MDETQERSVPLAGERWALSVTEVAARLGISRAHAYRMVATGELPAVRLGGRKWWSRSTGCGSSSENLSTNLSNRAR